MASRHNLSLKEKIELTNENNGDKAVLQRVLAEKYNISIGFEHNILKRKEEYLNDYQSNQNQQSKRKFKDPNAAKLDEQIYEWFVGQRSKNISISGPILQEKAREMAEIL